MRTYLCAAHAGGQGKTTLSQLLYLGLKQGGSDFQLVGADFLDEKGQSKLGKFFPGRVTELGIGAELSAVKHDSARNAGFRHWDRLGGMLLKGGHVIDVGANVIEQLLEWSADRHLKKIVESKSAPEIDLMLVCKAEMHAINDVTNLVRAVTMPNAFPAARIFVVLNEVAGAFSKTNALKSISSAAPGVNLHFVRLARCYSELWPYLEDSFTPVNEALAMSEDELSDRFGIDVWTATAGKADLQRWFDAVVTEFRTNAVLI